MAARRGPATRGKSEPQGQLAATTTSFGCSAGLSSMDVTKPQLFGVMDHVAPIDGPEVELEEPLVRLEKASSHSPHGSKLDGR